MSQFAASRGASLRRISVAPISRASRDARLISELPPPITVAPPPVARRIEFASLSRVVQDRFLSSVDGTFPPSPIVRTVSPAKANAPVTWVLVAVAASAAGVLLFRRGFGALGDARSIHSAGMAVVFAVLVAIVVLATLRAVAMLAEARVLPYAAGIYLFPTTLIDARRATLDVVPLTDLVAIEPQPGAIHLVFTGGRQFTFDVERNADVDALVAAIDAARAKAKELASDADPSGYYALVDPLHEPPGAVPDTTEARLALRMPLWARYGFALAVLAGIVLGPVLRWKRNEASDAQMFAEVKAQDSVAAYRAYLAHGGAHRDEVAQVLLPQAEARDAHAVVVAELERAAKVGTLAALRTFATEHPNHGLDDQLAQAMHAVYETALDRYRPLAPDADSLAFVTRLLAYSEDHGPVVRVRFVRGESPTLAAADHAVEASSKFAGIASYPAQYFDDANADAAEAVVYAAVRARFAAIFPAEIVDVQPASATDEGGPVLTIDHRVEWTEGLVTTVAPPGVFVTPSFELSARFFVPDDGVPGSTLALTTTVPAVLTETTDVERVDGGPAPEATIYGAMSRDAFDRFAGTLLARIVM